MSLPKIINQNKAKDIPPQTINGVNFGWYYAPPLPQQGTFEYVAEEFDVIRSNPNPKPGAYKRSKATGEIVMTPYEHSSYSTENHIASLDYEVMAVADRRAYRLSTCVVRQPTPLTTRWTRQGDFSSWSADVPVLDVSTIATDAEIRDAINLTSTAAAAASKAGFDALTEFAERKSTAQFFSDVTDNIRSQLHDFASGEVDDRGKYYRKSIPRQLLLHGDDMAKKWAGKWLAFRYALMPLIYSYQDIMKVIRDGGNSYNTVRKAEFWDYLSNVYDATGTTIVNIPLGSSKVSSIVKSMFTGEGLSRNSYQQTQINPFNTAWELLPFSFIVDWFVNVGDYIAANLGADLSSQSVGCTVVKHDYEIASFLVRKEIVTTGSVIPAFGPCDAVSVDMTYKIHYDDSQLLRLKRVRSYKRSVYQPSNGHIVVNPDMNWKRYIDAFSIAYLLNRKKIRSYLR